MSRFVIDAPAEPAQAPAAGGRRFVVEQPQPSMLDRVVTSMPGRALRGAGTIIEGGAEALPYALGQIASLGGAAPNAAANWLFDESRRVRQINADTEAEYQAARARVGQEGSDVARTLGNVGTGVALGMLTGGAAPTTLAGRAGYGAAVGAGSAALAPTYEPDARFAEKKTAQIVTGAATGAIATPAFGAVMDRVGPWVDRMLARSASRMKPEAVIEKLRFDLGREGIRLSDLDKGMRDQIGREISAALREGRQLDGAALARKLDFEAMGLRGTQGQVTRDPVQWATEYNLRQMGDAGRPLVDQQQSIRAATGQRLAEYGGAAPGEAFDRGTAAMGALQRADQPVKGMVDSAYQAARSAAGRDARLQPWQFAQMANDAIDQGNLGAVLPDTVRGLMNRVARGEVPLTVDVASQMQSVLSAQARMLRQAGNREGALAVDTVADALRRTDMEAGATGVARDAFNAAKALAASRFATQKAAPAYKAALEAATDPQKFPPEKFIDQFVLRGTRDAVRNLSEILPEDGAQAVRQHLVKHLQEAAFGPGGMADAPMRVASYQKALAGIGREKLRMFLPADVVDDLFRIGRVNAYATQAPVGAVPNRSGTAAALAGILQRVPGANLVIGVGGAGSARRAVVDALSPQVPSEVAPVLTPALRDLVGAVPLGIGMSQ